MPKTTSQKLKLPPQNLEAEQTVLGSVLIDTTGIIKVADMLVPADFYDPKHALIFEAILELYGKRQPVDIMTVGNFLKERGELQNVGGSGYLAELTNQVTTASHVAHYAQIVKDKRARRDLIRHAAETTEHAFDSPDDIIDLLADIQQKFFSISQKSIQQNFTAIKDELGTAYQRLEAIQAGEGALRGITTGFTELDKHLSGFQKSDLIVLGARPSLGKTSLALDMARNAAVRGGVSVGVFSLEMSKDQIVDRLISAESQVPLWKLRNGRIREDSEFQLLQNGMDRLSAANIFIDDTPSPNILEMRAMAQRLKLEHGLDLLIVDYLQLIKPRTNSDNIVAQVTETSRGLKALARELQIPVIAVSQLSRAVDQRDNKIPRLSDLRESGSIEQDADVVMFIYRKDRDKQDVPPEEQNIAQVIIAKHRNGPLATVDFRFDPEFTTFKPLDKTHKTFDDF
ncbi:MAG: replicative DNA helicase [bacterium]|nr:replicative DNA helicase [bacterium]